MTWTQAIHRWRALPPEQRREIRLSHVPTRVARSMAFEGEPVDRKMLETALASRITRPGSSTRPLAD